MIRETARWAICVMLLATAACSGGGSWTATPKVGFPEPGDRAPGFTLASADGTSLGLEQFEKRSSVLLYFSMGPG